MKDEDKYNEFYENFSKNIKLGIHEDSTNREKLAKLLRYSSTKSGDSLTSFDDYIGRMLENQKSIYYVTGENKKAVESSPFIERLVKQGYEVLFMIDAIDEYALQQLKEYEDYNLVSVTKEGLELDESEEDKKEFEEYKETFNKLCTTIKDILNENIEKVVVSSRLTDSPCVLVTGEFGWSANMERIMKAQTLGNNQMSSMSMMSKKTLELNPYHPIIKNLKEQVEPNKSFKDLVWLLYDTSLLASGFSLEEPTKFSNRIHRLINLGLDLDDGSDDEEQSIESIDSDICEESTMEEVD